MVEQIPFICTFSAESGSGANAELETDVAKDGLPTVFLTADCVPFKLGVLKDIAYRITPTAAETYTFMVFEDALAGNMASNSRMLYESENLRASGIDYRVPCEIPFYLDNSKVFWLATDWTGAPGNSFGYFRLAGIAYV